MSTDRALLDTLRRRFDRALVVGDVYEHDYVARQLRGRTWPAELLDEARSLADRINGLLDRPVLPYSGAPWPSMEAA